MVQTLASISGSGLGTRPQQYCTAEDIYYPQPQLFKRSAHQGSELHGRKYKARWLTESRVLTVIYAVQPSHEFEGIKTLSRDWELDVEVSQ